MKEQNGIKTMVRRRYGSLAAIGGDCCDTSGARQSSCCCPEPAGASEKTVPRGFFYSDQEIGAAPKGSFLGLGCGNPLALAGIRGGETVLDLGSGAGFDCFLAAQKVGSGGKVIGVDMTPEMVSRARANAGQEGYNNVEFRLGELENLPVADGTVDVIISNCVVNLSPDKPRVFVEAFRVLKPGGRLMIMDMIAKTPLPDRLRDDPDLYCSCITGAAEIREVERMLAEAGFRSIRIEPGNQSPQPSADGVREDNVHQFVSSAGIEAVKPSLLNN